MVRLGTNFWSTNMQTYSPYQQKILLENPNVLRVANHKVFYTPKFKIRALKSHMQGMTSAEIFIKAGFDPSYFKFDYFKETLK
jgi:hypothetical protein